MKFGDFRRLALSPPDDYIEKGDDDAGLRFTDILFGFVISQVFLRLQNWGELSGYVRWQLALSTVLVLGSWIGFRHSVNRSAYKLKFFNLPLLRFALDQAMVILYFRVATLTPRDPAVPVDPAALVDKTFDALLIIAALYFLWDLAGMIMGLSPKYANSGIDGWAIAITTGFLALAAVLWHLGAETDVDAHDARVLLASAVALLLAYRWAKEIRTTLKKPA